MAKTEHTPQSYGIGLLTHKIRIKELEDTLATEHRVADLLSEGTRKNYAAKDKRIKELEQEIEGRDHQDEVERAAEQSRHEYENGI